MDTRRDRADLQKATWGGKREHSGRKSTTRPVELPTGWAVIEYVAEYCAGKAPAALAALARQQGGVSRLRDLAQFFQASVDLI